jgi:hypothetical protein
VLAILFTRKPIDQAFTRRAFVFIIVRDIPKLTTGKLLLFAFARGIKLGDIGCDTGLFSSAVPRFGNKPYPQ